jgi:hypothetical protein
MASPSTVLIETLVFIFDEPPVVPVTTTRSMFRPSLAGACRHGASHVQDCGSNSGGDAAQFEGACIHFVSSIVVVMVVAALLSR